MINGKNPRVSVIITFLNEEEYLPESVESVIEQDFTDWELLLVDDGSTNNSTAIAKNYADRYPQKIFYIEHPGHINKGVCASRNLGVEKARGELIALFDADDKWLPKKLSAQVALFDSNPNIGMLAEASLFWHSWQPEPLKKDIILQVGPEQNKTFEPPTLIPLIYPLGKTYAPCPSGLMLKKSAILKAGGFEESFIKKYQLYEDQAFLCKIYLQEKVYISSDCNNLYRQRSTSVMHWVHADGQYHVVRRYFLDWLQQYLQRNNITHKQVHAYLQKALRQYRYPKLYYLTNVLPKKVKNKVKRTLKQR
ncbi:family 2 glycosyl transferase [Flammeovirgaceae bacterium 311]|nr:family 2 glycosyl transferase [Flammeovirgaceae bacterium 311]